MATKLIWFMLSFIATMAIGPALALLVSLVLRANIDRLIAQHQIALSLLLALYGIFTTLMFFWLQDLFIVFRPVAGTVPVSKTELVTRLEKSFAAPVAGKKVFDFMKGQDRVVITWSSSIDYYQISNAGGTGMKRVVVLTLDEKNHDAFFIMKDKDWRWNLAKGFFDFTLNYSLGIYSEHQTEYRPSVVFSEDGLLRVDLKKLTYSSNDLWLPIQTAVLSAGWILRGGMMPNFFHRILFSLPLAMIFFLIGYFVTGLTGATPSKRVTSNTVVGTKADGQEVQPDIAAELQSAVPHMTAENIELILDGIMKSPKEYLTQDIKTAFIAYSNGYLSKADKKEDFAAKLKSFAKTHRIHGLRE